ncbi:hypothetical protein ACFLYH_02040 [Candidatus Dependentiae bacterium]
MNKKKSIFNVFYLLILVTSLNSIFSMEKSTKPNTPLTIINPTYNNPEETITEIIKIFETDNAKVEIFSIDPSDFETTRLGRHFFKLPRNLKKFYKQCNVYTINIQNKNSRNVSFNFENLKNFGHTKLINQYHNIDNYYPQKLNLIVFMISGIVSFIAISKNITYGNIKAKHLLLLNIVQFWMLMMKSVKNNFEEKVEKKFEKMELDTNKIISRVKSKSFKIFVDPEKKNLFKNFLEESFLILNDNCLELTNS